jgi:hypothetical protein
MGGEITPDKLLVLNNFLQTGAERVVLLGEFGLAQYLNKRNIENIAENFSVSAIKRKTLQKILD